MSPKTIRVFEFDRLAVGAQRRSTDGGRIRFTASHFEELVRFQDAQASRFLRVGHRQVQFLNYVGFLQLRDLGIEILPKIDRTARDESLWRDALLDMLVTAGRLQLSAPTRAQLETRRAPLLDIYLSHFLERVESLIREGLTRGYRKVQGNLNVFRGRLLTAQHIRANSTLAQRCYSEHQVYDFDHPANQLLRSALDVLHRRPLRHDLSIRVVRLRDSFFDRVRPLDDPTRLDRIVVTRATARYAEALDIARMIIRNRSPTMAQGGQSALALLFDMNRLWEAYVFSLLRSEAPPELRITKQQSRKFWSPEGGRVTTVRPDIVVSDRRSEKPLLVVDTKWKMPRSGGPGASALRQMFVYNELFDCARALLLYPGHPDERTSTRGNFVGQSHRCDIARLALLTDGGRFDRKVVRARARALLAEA